MNAPATRSFNIASYMELRAAERPFQRAVVFPQGRDRAGNVAWTHLTYRQLNALTDEYARGFAAQGIRRGDRVSLLVKPCLEFIPLVFAIFKIGALPVLIDPGMGLKGFLACVERIKPRALIGEPAAHVLRKVFRRAFASVEIPITNGKSTGFWGGVTLEQCRVPGGEPFPTAQVGPDEEAAILFTSGSTGPAKGVTYTHRIFDAQTRHIQQMYGIEPGEIDLACFPLFGLFSMAMGMTVVIPELDPTKPAKADPRKLIDAIQAHGCTSAFGSPAIWKNMALYARDHKVRLPSMRRILMAGAPIPVWMHEAFQEIFEGKAELHTPYGATESLPVASIASREVLAETAAKTRGGAGICVGHLAPGLTLRIIRISDAPIPTWSDDLCVPDGCVGEICVKGEVVTPEYKEEPAHTAAAKILEDGQIWHRIGDVGYLDDQGRLWFCGRKSHRVICQDGTTLFPDRCEAIFNEHPAVYRTALVGVAGEPVLVVEREPGEALSAATPESALRAELLALGAANPLTAGVRRVLLHPAFPVDVRHNAKIDRPKLAAWAQQQLRA